MALNALRLLATRDVVGASTDFVLRAMALSVQHPLSNWDAAIVQAAIDASCDVLYSEDLQSGQRFGALEVVNPFAPGTLEASPTAYAALASRRSTARKRAGVKSSPTRR